MGRRGIVWKTPDITADGLKMFACIVMLIQSIGIVDQRISGNSGNLSVCF